MAFEMFKSVPSWSAGPNDGGRSVEFNAPLFSQQKVRFAPPPIYILAFVE